MDRVLFWRDPGWMRWVLSYFECVFSHYLKNFGDLRHYLLAENHLIICALIKRGKDTKI